MTQKGFAPIIVILIVTLIAVVSLYIYRPRALENLVSNLLNENESISTPDDSLPTTTSKESPTKIPTTKKSPTIFIPSPTPTYVPTVHPTTPPTPYPTSSENWEEGPPDKKDRPYVGG